MRNAAHTQAVALLALIVLALASIAAGVWAAFGWPWAAITTGALLWIELCVYGRQDAKAARAPQVTE